MNLIYYQTLSQNAPFGVCVADLQGGILFCNPRFITFFELREKDNLLSLKEIPPEVVRESLWSKHSPSKLYEFKLEKPPEEARWYNFKSFPIPDAKEQVMFVFEDITKTKNFEILMREAISAAEAGNKAKSEFFANISHELRTPLNGIFGLLNLLEDSGLNEEQGGYLKMLKESAMSLLTIIKDILDFSSLEDGTMTLEKTPFKISSLLTRLQETFSPSSEKKGLKFYIENKLTWDPVLVADHERLYKVLYSLASNAFKFTRHGSFGVIAEELSRSETSVTLKLSVADTGIGIPDNKKNSLFEIFTQIDSSSTREFGGMGLGLALCRKILRLMDGEIDFESRDGEGSRFWIEVAFETSREDSLAVQNSTNGSKSLKASILLVEDNELNRKIAYELITKTGCSVDTAENGVEACKKANANHYDLIFMDCQMPLMDGYEATGKIKALSNHSFTPIVALTANAMGYDKKKCFDAGMDDYISKPIKISDIKRILERWLVTDMCSHRIVFDPQKLVDITDGDLSIIEKAVGLFLEDIHNQIAALKDSMIRNDFEVMKRTAHTMKSSAAYLGAEKLRCIAYSMEKNSALKEPGINDILLDKFISELDSFKKIIENFNFGEYLKK